MFIEFQAPLIGQLTNNLCWYAAFEMIEAWYNTLLPARPTAFTPTQMAHLRRLNWGVQPSAIADFAKFMGLTIKFATPDTASLGRLLQQYGPLWYPAQNNGYLPVGSHHVVVIRGIRGTDLMINDPSPVGSGAKRVIPAAAFFQQLKPLNNQFLVMLKNSKPDTTAIYNDLKVR